MADQLDYKQLRGTPVIQILSASPDAAPADGYLYLYPKSDSRFYQMDSSGNEKPIDSTAINYFFETRRLIGLLVSQLREIGVEFINEELNNLSYNIK